MEDNTVKDLEKMYYEYFFARIKEITDAGLTVRLIIDFQKGNINQIQNQEILSGASIIQYNLSRFN